MEAADIQLIEKAACGQGGQARHLRSAGEVQQGGDAAGGRRTAGVPRHHLLEPEAVGGGWWRLVAVYGSWCQLVAVSGGRWRLVRVGGGW